MTAVAGLLLAAGAGRRMGRAKALVAGAHGVPWVVAASRTLAAGGCTPVVVVIGAEADAVRAALADEPVRIVDADAWRTGMGASLRAGLDALAAQDTDVDRSGAADADACGVDAGGAHAPRTDAALVHLVDLPDVGPDVIRRLVAVAGPGVLARARYGDGVPVGHPVLIGRDHWIGVSSAARGDVGARDYLAGRPVIAVDCGDLATGGDVDRPAGLPVGAGRGVRS